MDADPREQHSRAVARYQTDLTDAEWRVVSPLLPEPCATGRPREWPMREIVNGIFDVLPGWIAWAAAAERLPALADGLSLVCGMAGQGVFEKINHALVLADRERVGRDASPSAAIIDQPERQDRRGRRLAISAGADRISGYD